MFTIVSSHFELNTNSHLCSHPVVKHNQNMEQANTKLQLAVVGMLLLKDDVSIKVPNRWKPNQSSDY